jgi:hypothetical protein
LELFYGGEHSGMLPGLVDTVLTRLRTHTVVKQVFCALRGYQAEAAKVLEERGFDPILEQDLLIKYTTATARVPQFESLPLHSEVIERLPRRVPSFLHSSPRDKTVG